NRTLRCQPTRGGAVQQQTFGSDLPDRAQLCSFSRLTRQMRHSGFAKDLPDSYHLGRAVLRESSVHPLSGWMRLGAVLVRRVTFKEILSQMQANSLRNTPSEG